MSFTKQTQCHLHGGKEGLNHGQALPETDQAERKERIAVHHEPVRPSPVRVQGNAILCAWVVWNASRVFLKVMRPLKVAKPKPLTTRKREFLNYLIISA